MIKPASPHRIRSKSLARASLELGRVLADRNGLTFRAKGTCMYPTLRAGDVLRIKPCTAADIALGDIAVGRKPGYLFAHRVIDKGLEKGRTYILTRPDTARVGSDGPTFDDSLLGRVVAIERNGRPVPLRPAAQRWPLRACYAVRRQLIEAAQRLRAGVEQRLETVQSGALYRGLAQRWRALSRPRLSCAVRLPTPALGDAVYRELPLETFNLRADWRGRPVGRFTLTLHLNENRRPAAWATFARDGAADWRVVESFVGARYRGWGLDEELLRRADAVLDAGSAPPEPAQEGPEARAS
jgi:signal peptidase